ncbi:hypothetical protein O163_08755 [Caldanaerobacter subterraneus subsp. yonseiensis KB-1]|uniref:Uncharacterized protein n=1 Tax=Caldanaerobacter subterraneus subsp. yonseiensis KB-1 TaxID=1388761 RepID=U5CFS8_CALSX|nr:hypothetical protein O163_08755 [Caldanaerobacter subterraneus subsp. yonseiensis KB-1]
MTYVCLSRRAADLLAADPFTINFWEGNAKCKKYL